MIVMCFMIFFFVYGGTSYASASSQSVPAKQGYAQGGDVARSLMPRSIGSPDVFKDYAGADVPEAGLNGHELEARAREEFSKASREVASGDTSKLSAQGMILNSHLNKKYFPPSSFEELFKTSDDIVQDPIKVLEAQSEERPAKVVTKTTQETCEESAPPFLLEDTSSLTHVSVAEKKSENQGDELIISLHPYNYNMKKLCHSSYSYMEMSFKSVGKKIGTCVSNEPRGYDGAPDPPYTWLPALKHTNPYYFKFYSMEELRLFLWRAPLLDTHCLVYSSDFAGYISPHISSPVFQTGYFRRSQSMTLEGSRIDASKPWEPTSKEDHDLGPQDMGVTHDQWSLPTQFESLVDSGVCHYAGEECTQGPQTRVIAGAPVTRACWAKKRKYRCQFPSRNTCEELRRKGCTQVNSTCAKRAGEACAVYTQTYACRQVLTKPGRTRVRGKVPFCLDGSCHKVAYEPNKDMMEAISKLAALKQVAQDMDANARTVFKGEALGCGSHCASFSSCCGVSGGGWGVSLGLSNCSEHEKKLAKMRGEGKCILTGTYCAEKVLGVCIRKKTNFCCFGSKLARVFHEEARRQLGLGFGSAKEPACQGLTFEQLASVDFEKLNLSEVFNDLFAGLSTPNATAINQKFKSDWGARLPKSREEAHQEGDTPMKDAIDTAKLREAPSGFDKTTNTTHKSRDNTERKHHELQVAPKLVF